MRTATFERTQDAARDAIPVEVQRLAAQLAVSNGRPDDVSLLRWALNRLPPTTKKNQLQIAGQIIDLLNLHSDNEARRIGRTIENISICFAECTPDSPCTGDVAGVRVEHHPAAGWVVAGTIFTSQRDAVRHAWKLATLKMLAREIGAIEQLS